MEYFVKIFERNQISQLESVVKTALDTIKNSDAIIFHVNFFGSSGKYCTSIIYLAEEALE